MVMSPSPQRVLVTGASGYVGGRLVPKLLAAGHHVRCLVRSPRKLSVHGWYDDERVEIVRADLSNVDAATLESTMEGCASAYYLVHAMVSAGSAYEREDRRMAETFVAAASRAGIERIVYLGGLGEMGGNLSRHLASRREVERILREGPVPTTALRAAMIIGSGSASFEILRYLVERLPVMVTPRWVATECQPIAIRDVLDYLTRCLDVPETADRAIDIGGPDVLTYAELMQIMAEERGLRRRVILPVPVLTPKLSSLWIHLVTPLSHRIARPLAEGLRNRVVCRDDTAVRLLGAPSLTVRQAIRAALDRVRANDVETVWSTAGTIPGDPDWAGGTTFVDRRTIRIDAPADAVFRAVCRVGGGHGWYSADWLWRLRGWMDRVVGGPGLRRGRRDPETVSYGEALDFWRVVGLERDRRLALRAEMKLPGDALLAFALEEEETGDRSSTVLEQKASFLPKGLLGLAYWYAVLPFHGYVFRGMLDGIRRAAESIDAASGTTDAPRSNGGRVEQQAEEVTRAPQ